MHLGRLFRDAGAAVSPFRCGRISDLLALPHEKTANGRSSIVGGILLLRLEDFGSEHSPVAKCCALGTTKNCTRSVAFDCSVDG